MPIPERVSKQKRNGRTNNQEFLKHNVHFLIWCEIEHCYHLHMSMHNIIT